MGHYLEANPLKQNTFYDIFRITYFIKVLVTKMFYQKSIIFSKLLSLYLYVLFIYWL